MGNAESTAASGGFAKVGYHVLLVSHGSPSDNILQPFWDIIVGSQGHVFDKDDSALVQLFQTHLNKPLTLTVYSMKTEKTREVTIVPNNTWGTGGLAGIIIRFGNFAPLLELVWHVLDVYVDSPASEAQLVSRTDFIIGIPEKAFKDPEDFFNYINSHLRQTVQLFVYNSSSEQVRTVSITPNNEWGGNGVLGCDIGYGYLHRIPTRMTISRTASPSISPSPIPPSSSSVPPSPSPSPVPFVTSSSIPPVSPSVSSSSSSSSSSSTSTPSATTPVSSVSPSLSSIPPVRFSPTPLPDTTNYPIPTNYTAFSPLSPLSPIAPYNPDIPYSFSSLPPLPPAFTPTHLPYLVGENSSNSPLQQNSIMTPITEGLEQVKL